MIDTRFTFLLPGYLSPLRANAQAATDITCPSLLQWRVVEGRIPWQAALARSLGDIDNDGLRLPTARLLASDFTQSPVIARVDPVHLSADRDTAKLFPRQMLDIKSDEEDQILSDLNHFLSEDGLHIQSGLDNGWYLCGSSACNLASLPPSFLANRNASVFLPTGDGTEYWRRLTTEIQMLLHNHDVNQLRASEGRLPINGVWIWGAGDLQASLNLLYQGETNSMRVYGDDDYTEALCGQLSLAYQHLDRFNPDEDHSSVIVDTRIAKAVFAQDESSAQMVARDIDTLWLAPLCERFKKGQVGNISIFNEDGDIGELDAVTHKRADAFLPKIQNWLRSTFGK